MPAVVARGEDRHGRQPIDRIAGPKVAVEERRLEMLHVIASGSLLAEVEVPEPAAVAAPCPVGPRPHDQMHRSLRALPHHGPVEVPRPVAILGVVGAAHDEHRRADVVARPARVAGPPPLVVVGVSGHLLPKGVGSQQRRQVGPRRVFQKERAVVGRKGQFAPGHPVRRRVSRRGVHRIEEPHGVAQHQDAVVVHVVTHVPVGHRRLRRDGLHRRVTAQGPHQGVEARIGAAREPDATVVAGNMFHEPLHRVVAVRGLVHVAEAHRTDVHELALAHVTPPHVLLDDDIAAIDIAPQVAFFEPGGECVRAVGPRAVRRAENDDRGAPRSLGGIDRGVEAHAVAHGDTVFGLVVERADRLGACGGGSQHSAPEQRQESAEIHGGIVFCFR